MEEATRKDIQEIRPKIEEAIRGASFEDFKEILTSKLGIALGSERRYSNCVTTEKCNALAGMPE